MRVVLIGGGEIGRGNTSYQTEAIDKRIVSMTEKDHPNFLFIGLASSFADSYYDTIKKIYKDLGCNTVYLKKNNLIHNPDLVRQKFQDADIIYVGGGDTIKLMEKIQKYHLKDLFLEAFQRNCVLAGISAGAILFSKDGYSDSYILRGESNQYSFVPGLGFIDISITPHYHNDFKKIDQLKRDLDGSSKEVIGIEDLCALEITDNGMKVISTNGAIAYQISNQNEFIEKEL